MKVSVLIWKHQDRMSNAGSAADESDPAESAYEHVIWADREIKRLYASWPGFMREVVYPYPSNTVTSWGSLPVGLMPGLVLLCTAHKVCS